jgi:catalase
MDAYGHCKTIAHNEATQPLLDKAGVEKDGGVVAIEAFAGVGTRRHWAREARVRDLA